MLFLALCAFFRTSSMASPIERAGEPTTTPKTTAQRRSPQPHNFHTQRRVRAPEGAQCLRHRHHLCRVVHPRHVNGNLPEFGQLAEKKQGRAELSQPLRHLEGREGGRRLDQRKHECRRRRGWEARRHQVERLQVGQHKRCRLARVQEGAVEGEVLEPRKGREHRQGGRHLGRRLARKLGGHARTPHAGQDELLGRLERRHPLRGGGRVKLGALEEDHLARGAAPRPNGPEELAHQQPADVGQGERQERAEPTQRRDRPHAAGMELGQVGGGQAGKLKEHRIIRRGGRRGGGRPSRRLRADTNQVEVGHRAEVRQKAGQRTIAVHLHARAKGGRQGQKHKRR
ncbi:hypothetical protein BU14_0746s0011 [Porphyra umbilicalis]|uniref:Uncharacterized protein n=1 Tax=Porphyra umbilicalis TaxID=2786 RepID=A0A1X6NPE3_PORUM|nr:hypothetical protein BU14_0746s0011 [Porphyra umbilicalis]|eukprot:OSX70471.1 hypothetical protein BU14_0746s0011 [Porphyra umbilicalis]